MKEISDVKLISQKEFLNLAKTQEEIEKEIQKELLYKRCSKLLRFIHDNVAFPKDSHINIEMKECIKDLNEYESC